MIERKTADLIVVATVGAGLVAGVSKAELALLDTYGRSLGMAYQICDDVVSIWGGSKLTGKGEYGDLKECKKTLPVLYAHETLPNTKKQQLLEIYADKQLMTAERCGEVWTLLDDVGTKQAMRNEIKYYADAAKVVARNLGIDLEKKELLLTLVDTLLPSV
jgi:geranylgeranyl pyrophosphate synthase